MTTSTTVAADQAARVVRSPGRQPETPMVVHWRMRLHGHRPQYRDCYYNGERQPLKFITTTSYRAKCWGFQVCQRSEGASAGGLVATSTVNRPLPTKIP